MLSSAQQSAQTELTAHQVIPLFDRQSLPALQTVQCTVPYQNQSHSRQYSQKRQVSPLLPVQLREALEPALQVGVCTIVAVDAVTVVSVSSNATVRDSRRFSVFFFMMIFSF
jgi:hypothetical protein